MLRVWGACGRVAQEAVLQNSRTQTEKTFCNAPFPIVRTDQDDPYQQP